MTHHDRTEQRLRPVLGVEMLLAVLVAIALTASACSANVRTGEVEIYGLARLTLPAAPKSGANVIEVFNEMHYQPSYKSQEGPRLLPAPDSVPVTGRSRRYATLKEYQELEIPVRVEQSYDESRAQGLFAINCLVCHGPTLRGNTEQEESLRAKILRFMDRGPFPEDLTSDLTKGSTDGELFAFISNGGRQGFAATERGKKSRSPMPEFQLLLTDEERWTLVMYLRSKALEAVSSSQRQGDSSSRAPAP